MNDTQANEDKNAEKPIGRRDFTRLAAAALGGIAVGTLVACGKSKESTAGGTSATEVASADGAIEEPQDVSDIDPNLLAEEPHVCRGLNTCKGQGKGGANECAGMGACANVEKHVCNGMNDCKGKGGCGEHPGQNQCNGKGACAVPLTDKTWAKARPKFEEVMTAKGIQFGPAPAK